MNLPYVGVEANMKSGVKTIADDNFSKEIENGVVLVDFTAEWCGPCRMLAPVLENLQEALKDKLNVIKIDVDASPKTTTAFQITSVPTLILFKDGKEATRIVGLKDLETLKKIVLQAL